MSYSLPPDYPIQAFDAPASSWDPWEDEEDFQEHIEWVANNLPVEGCNELLPPSHR